MNQAGFSRVCITPTEPLPLGGYPGREAGHTSVSHPVYVRAACLSIGEAPPVYLITADLCGWGPSLCSEIYARFAEEMGVPREHVMLNASHGHCTPITVDVLPLFYRMNETMTAAVARYTRRVIDATLEAAKAAKASQEKCTLDFSFGFAGFGVNRRRVRGQGFHLTSATDPDVPVLVAKRRDGSVAGIIFGYACHTTSQFGFVLDPDYGGWASSELEAVFPGAEAMFVAGCGGDVNPLPRYRPGLETTYGHVLACAVLDAMGIDGLRSGCLTDGFRLDQQFSAGVRDLSLPLEPPGRGFPRGSRRSQRRLAQGPLRTPDPHPSRGPGPDRGAVCRAGMESRWSPVDRTGWRTGRGIQSQTSRAARVGAHVGRRVL